MADQKKQDALVPGRNIYLYNKKTIMYDRLTNQNYIIHPQNVRAYNYLSIRYFIAFAVGFTMAVVTDNIWIGLGIGLVVLAVMSYIYYKRYLPSLSVDQSFKRPERVAYTDSLAQRLSAGRLLMAFFVSLSLAFVLVFNAYINEYPTVILVLNCLLGLAAAVLSGACLIAFFKKRKADKQ